MATVTMGKYDLSGKDTATAEHKHVVDDVVYYNGSENTYAN